MMSRTRYLVVFLTLAARAGTDGPEDARKP